MKRIFLVLGFICVMQITAFAEVKENISENQIGIEINHNLILDDIDETLTFYFLRLGNINRVFGVSEDYWLTVSSHSTDYKKYNSPSKLLFSRKNLPYFITAKSNSEKEIKIKKVYSFSNNEVNFYSHVNKKILMPILEAEKVLIVVPYKNGKSKRIELPSSLVDDLKYALSCDLRKQYKARWDS